MASTVHVTSDGCRGEVTLLDPSWIQAKYFGFVFIFPSPVPKRSSIAMCALIYSHRMDVLDIPRVVYDGDIVYQ